MPGSTVRNFPATASSSRRHRRTPRQARGLLRVIIIEGGATVALF